MTVTSPFLHPPPPFCSIPPWTDTIKPAPATSTSRPSTVLLPVFPPASAARHVHSPSADTLRMLHILCTSPVSMQGTGTERPERAAWCRRSRGCRKWYKIRLKLIPYPFPLPSKSLHSLLSLSHLPFYYHHIRPVRTLFDATSIDVEGFNTRTVKHTDLSKARSTSRSHRAHRCFSNATLRACTLPPTVQGAHGDSEDNLRGLDGS
ncbi:hypothetical protein V8E36_001965 [Tilletia maclaganii]